MVAHQEEKQYNTTVQVKVNGVVKTKSIDMSVQKQALTIMKKLKSKNKCEDLFKNTVIDRETGLRMYP